LPALIAKKMASAGDPGQNHLENMTVPQPSPYSIKSDSHRSVLIVCFFLTVAVFVVFGRTLQYPFVNFDDGLYVYENPQVKQGLTLSGIVWMFSHEACRFYHPLTMTSLMLDSQVHGLNAGGYHLTNVLLHATNAILLFLVLRRMMGLCSDKRVKATATQAGTLWTSAFVAAVFAVHPLHVESVAWVAERKDVLSGLFFMLTLWAYTRYVEQSKVQSPKFRGFYGLALLLFALGLMSKPMLVTVPFVLLLLDYWPLERLTLNVSRKVLLSLVSEKLPFVLLSMAMCVATIVTQQEAIKPTIALPLSVRLGHVLISYVTYVVQMIWPDKLAVFYTYRFDVPVWQVAGAGALLLVITALTLGLIRKLPCLAVGWLWYLGMLVPVIGFVQAGGQSHADRFTYLPQIGLYIAIAWAIRGWSWTTSWRWHRQLFGGTALIVTGMLMVCAWNQTAYWRDSETLWKHALACTTGNYTAQNYVADTLAEQGRSAEAMEHYQKALEINSHYPDANNNLGTVFLNQERLEEAAEHYRRALEANPSFADAHNNLGILLTKQDRTAEAIEHYQKAIKLNPNRAEFYNNLGNLLARQNQTTEAIEQFQKALEVEPDNAKVHYNLAGLFIAQGRWDEAIAHYQRALKQMPDSTHAHYQLGLALQSRGKFAAAIAQFQRVLELDPKHVSTQNNLAWLLATCPDGSLRNGQKAVELAQRAVQFSGDNSPEILDTLAAAYAEAGKFAEAIQTAQRALDLSAAQNKKNLAEIIQNQVHLFETNAPFHEKP
jgi:tetratricopeptide (TPR) repeat protein